MIEETDYDEVPPPPPWLGILLSRQCQLALLAYHDLELEQLDVNTTFLLGNWEEEMFMEQPKGFTQTGT